MRILKNSANAAVGDRLRLFEVFKCDGENPFSIQYESIWIQYKFVNIFWFLHFERSQSELS